MRANRSGHHDGDMVINFDRVRVPPRQIIIYLNEIKFQVFPKRAVTRADMLYSVVNRCKIVKTPDVTVVLHLYHLFYRCAAAQLCESRTSSQLLCGG